MPLASSLLTFFISRTVAVGISWQRASAASQVSASLAPGGEAATHRPRVRVSISATAGTPQARRRAVRARPDRLPVLCVGPRAWNCPAHAGLIVPNPTSSGGFDETKHPRGQPDNPGQFKRNPIPLPPAARPRPPAHALIDHVLAGGTLPEEAIPKTPADAFELWLPPADVSYYTARLDDPDLRLGGAEHYQHWRGEPPAPGHAKSVRRKQKRWWKAEARSVKHGRDPYPKECVDDEDRDDHDRLVVVGDLEMAGEPFGVADIVSAVIRRRRALFGRGFATPVSVSAIRRQMLVQLVREDVFRHSCQPGFPVGGSAMGAAYDRAKAMVAAAGL